MAVYETLGTKLAITDYSLSRTNVGLLITLSGVAGLVQLLMFRWTWNRFFDDVQLMFGGVCTMVVAQLIFFTYRGAEAGPPHLWRFILCIVLVYGFGYPIGYTAVIGAFSKVKRHGPQAALLSWFATAGSAARIVLPIVAGYLEEANVDGPYCLVLALLTLSAIFLLLTSKHIRYCIGETSTNVRRGRKARMSVQQTLCAGCLAAVFILSLIYLFSPPSPPPLPLPLNDSKAASADDVVGGNRSIRFNERKRILYL